MYNVYKIINSINDKVYVGRTKSSLAIRWKGHLQCLARGDKRQLYCAMRKYGVENFHIVLLKQCDSFQKMVQQEAYFCNFYNSYYNGYNMTTAGEINPMECEQSKKVHDDKMRSLTVRQKISETMKKVRAISKDYIYIHKDKEMKRIPESDLDTYLKQGWEKGTIKGKIRMHKNNKETTVFKDDVDLYLSSGWQMGGKHRIFSDQHLKNLNSSHKNISETFRKEQSARLKKYYANNPNWKTKSKKAVKITDPISGKSRVFNSCLEAARELGISESAARAGKFSQWVKLGYIKYKKSKYNKYMIEFIDRG